MFSCERIAAMSKVACLIILLFASCHHQRTGASTSNRNGTLIFHSGFEPDSRVIARGENADITGTDKSLPAPNDWDNDLDNNPEIGSFGIQFEGGDSSKRYAKIVADPVKPSNHALQFWLNEPNQKNGRVQATLYGNKGMKELYQSVRVFLPADVNAVKSFPKEVHWLTLSEFWNNITWSQKVPFGFRVTLGLGKEGIQRNELRFILDAQDCQLFENGSQKYTTIWAEVNRSVPVPIGKWFTMEYYFKQGGADSGRFFMKIKPDGQKASVVFDVKNFTHNTKDPAPDGLSDYNPLKLYTSAELVNYVRTVGHSTLQVYWDDLSIWKDRRPE